MALVVGFHAALLLLLTRGFGLVPEKASLPPPFDGTFIDDPTPDDPVPPATGPRFNDARISIAPPDRLEFESDDPPPDVITRDSPVDADPAGSAVPQPLIQGVRMDARHPLSQPYYPPDVIRAGGEGSLELQIYVLPDGRVGDARILKTSGFDSLDRAAIQEAKRNWRLLPATRDGEPFAQWYSLRVVFKLQSQR